MMLFCLVALFADALAPNHYLDMTMIDRLKGPSSVYLLGTDHIGRDALTRLSGGQGSYSAAQIKRKRGLLARILSFFNG